MQYLQNLAANRKTRQKNPFSFRQFIEPSEENYLQSALLQLPKGFPNFDPTPYELAIFSKPSKMW